MNQHQFSPKKFQYIVNRAGYEKKQNDHLEENALIFKQILSTNFLRKCMEISLDCIWISLKARVKTKIECPLLILSEKISIKH